MIQIDLSLPVQKLCAQNPELKEILFELGFTEITRPGMLATAGRFMTLPKGAAMRKIDMDTIIKALCEHGFEAAETQLVR